MKCKCGIELFKCDVVEYVEKYKDSKGFLEYPILTHKIYRCPKCFKTTKVKVK